MIPETDNRDSLLGQEFIPRFIPFFTDRITVTRSIYLDRQLQCRAIKIQDVRLERVLSSKFILLKVSISEMTPEYAFAFSRILAEMTGKGH